MKNPPIWESATRPLFVRSVWLDSGGGHRHFLLDYQPQRRFSDFNAKSKREKFRQTQSYDDYQDSDDHLIEEDNLQLIGSQKEQFHQAGHHHSAKLRPMSSVRKSSISPNHHPRSWDSIEHRIGLFKDEPPSKRSSLQDITSTISNLSNSNEKLAERVLNWLDLAGKSPSIRPAISPVHDIVPKKSSARIATVKRNKLAVHHHQSAAQPSQKPAHQPVVSRTTYSMSAKRPDSVKHITIIFNKEGIPIRYNRPVRYTDLCRSGYSNSGARRNSGGPFSANIYNRITSGDDNGTRAFVSMTPGGGAAFEKATMDLKRPPRVRISTVRKNHENDIGKAKPNPIVSRRILETSCNLREMKKQLHIFMPNLPKKSNLTVADDLTSIISGTISDLKPNENC